MTKRNPKQESSNLWDCVPQKGPCPMNCNQCFYNRSGAFYAGMEPLIPTPEEVGDSIVRMNCGHDSNLERGLVIETAKQYKHFFFNTSIPRFDFPGPVVFTANPKEEEADWRENICDINNFDKLMFVRLRVSATNLFLVEEQIKFWVSYQIPVVLTFMAYYQEEVLNKIVEQTMISNKNLSYQLSGGTGKVCRDLYYTYKVRHINSYWCPTKEFMKYVLDRMKNIGDRLVTMCGTLDSNWCRDCRNCETYYYQTIKYMKEVKK